MLKLYVFMEKFLAEPIRRSDRGATAVEYGLIVALVAAIIVGALVTLGGNISGVFANIATHI
jgi:pilus assembly protein Flp/PilA